MDLHDTNYFSCFCDIFYCLVWVHIYDITNMWHINYQLQIFSCKVTFGNILPTSGVFKNVPWKKQLYNVKCISISKLGFRCWRRSCPGFRRYVCFTILGYEGCVWFKSCLSDWNNSVEKGLTGKIFLR